MYLGFHKNDCVFYNLHSQFPSSPWLLVMWFFKPALIQVVNAEIVCNWAASSHFLTQFSKLITVLAPAQVGISGDICHLCIMLVAIKPIVCGKELKCVNKLKISACSKVLFSWNFLFTFKVLSTEGNHTRSCSNSNLKNVAKGVARVVTLKPIVGGIKLKCVNALGTLAHGRFPLLSKKSKRCNADILNSFRRDFLETDTSCYTKFDRYGQ